MAWQVYQIKHDPLYLGLIGLVEAIPAISLALFAGDFVDRRNPLTIYRTIIKGVLLSALLLLAVSSAPNLSVGRELAGIYLAAFIAGCARGFFMPSIYALNPQMVPRESLTASSAWLTTMFQIASVAGPCVGGLMYSWMGPRLAYAVEASIIVGAALSAAAIQLKPQPAGASAERPFERIAAGLRFVFAHDILLPALALDMFAVLFGGVEAILPLFADQILKIGAAGLGLLQAAPAVGALAGSALTLLVPVGRRAGRTLFFVVTGFGACILGFALSKVLWVSMLLLGLAGALDSVSMVIRIAAVQLASPGQMRGRVASVNSIFIGVSNELGAFESGVAAKLLGAVPSVLFGGCLTLVTVALAAGLSPSLRELDLETLS